MSETNCPTCNFPTNNSREYRLPRAVQHTIQPFANTLFVPNYGSIHVLKGDLTWINSDVMRMINENILLMRPCSIRVCNGSVFEAQELKESICSELRNDDQKRLNRLFVNAEKTAQIDDDVHTFSKERRDTKPSAEPIATKSHSADVAADKCPSTQWMSEHNYQCSKDARFKGCMSGRTMYVVPFAMGHIGGRHTLYGVQLTDDPILVLNLRATFRVSSSVWDAIGNSSNFIQGVHSIGQPRPIVRASIAGPEKRATDGSFIILKHDEKQIWAFGPSFGRNSAFQKSLAIRGACRIASKNEWLAENAAILSITDSKKNTIYVCYSSVNSIDSLELKAFESGEWKVDVLSNSTAWIHWHEGKLHAISPENDEMAAVSTADNFETLLNGSAANYEVGSWNPQNSKWPSDVGVPISALIFGVNRIDKYPVLIEANKWQDGVILAAGVRNNLKLAEGGSSPQLEHNPMMMKGYISYNFGKYVDHWLQMGYIVKGGGESSSQQTVPQIFMMNLNQEDDGKLIWPGGAENARVFEHIFKRCTNPSDDSNINSTPLGKIPKSLGATQTPTLFMIDIRFWLEELGKMKTFFDAQMGSSKPKQVEQIINDLSTKL